MAKVTLVDREVDLTFFLQVYAFVCAMLVVASAWAVSSDSQTREMMAHEPEEWHSL